MAFQTSLVLGCSFFLSLLVLVASALTSSIANCTAPTDYFNVSSLNRSSFPVRFIFGTASSAFQYEGAVREGGRGPSIWDTYTHQHPERIADHSNGDVAVDGYHRYEEDVKIIKEINFDAYRFSISWSRLLPNGTLSGGVNKEGIEFYNNLINGLLENGFEPFVTIFHWDVPQSLEDEYGGFLSPRIVKDFREYAEVCFREFGDRVKHWATLNEPYTFTDGGYATGTLAPGRCSEWQQLNCSGGDSGTEPYIVAHHQLLAHAAAVDLYKTNYQASQMGWIGIVLVSQWMVPYSEAKHNQNAALRALDFMFGWFMDPLTNGEYPDSMRSLVGNRLPKFTKQESKLLKGSFDFVGLNYYTAYYASYAPNVNNSANASYLTDALVNITNQRNGIPIGPQGGSDWLRVYPRGILDILLYIKTKYQNPPVYITENGINELNDAKKPLKEALLDNQRIDYHSRHLYYLKKAINHGVNLKGYFTWSLLDNFEWASGYTIRFGLNYVDFKDGLKRYPKLSALWFKYFLHKREYLQ
ncbi:beta-glucosidase 12-like [Ziziphus jujuba]|uniref:Beta-glucosidase 12-like n=1 Tax=Ziziphus jujuba TaxID=326968 RepID=A0ABM3IBC7_ZIZJJ|nr:beta-glucosidase 12-like [Ziziphus jujuba]